MLRHTIRGAVVGAVIFLTMVVAAVPALARGRDGQHTMHTAFGIVTSVTNQSIEVQTRDGNTVSLTLTNSTQVIREVNGSSNDLSVGAVVDLHATRGHTDVSFVHIYPPGTSLGIKKPSQKGPHRRPTHIRPDGRAMVTGASGNSISVRYPDGSTATYSLDSNLLVIKDVPGTLKDLAIGQRVAIDYSHGNSNAVRVLIMNA